ncbi:MAG: hypothetical protein R2752_18430 [Vicinamibacterales bacterium]
MPRGNHRARIDDKGRLKIPAAYKAFLDDPDGRGLYLTSIEGDSVLIYPMKNWLAVEERLSHAPSGHPSVRRFLTRVNYYGQDGEMDGQARVLIPQLLRESADMAGEVVVLGQRDYLEVWNHERFYAKLQREPFTDDDYRALAEFKF